MGGDGLQLLNKLNLYILFLNSQSKIRHIRAGCHIELCSTLLSIRQDAFPHTINTSSSWITGSGVWKCIRTAQASNTLHHIDIGKCSSSSYHSCLSALLRHWDQDEGLPTPCILGVQKDKALHGAVWITFL